MKVKFQFTPKAVQAGQKSSSLNAEPQLLAKSTLGQFTITNVVSRVLNIAAGENVMFLNDFDAVEAEIQNNNPEIVAYAQENGIDLTSRAAVEQLIRELGTWYIAKGENLFSAAGKPLMATARVTKDEKLAYIKEHGAEFISAMDDATRAAFAAARNVDPADEAALVGALVPEDVPSPEYPASSGSKTSTTSNATGTGLQLNFTDSNIWNALKADLGEDKENKIRVFKVDFANAVDADFHNGEKAIKVKAYPIEYVEDRDPVVRIGAKD